MGKQAIEKSKSALFALKNGRTLGNGHVRIPYNDYYDTLYALDHAIAALEGREWVSTASIFRPSTWGSGYWLPRGLTLGNVA